MASVTSAIEAFLPCRTPQAWLERARNEQQILLSDHANCEKKAASTALNLLYRYTDNHQLLQKLSRLAREELRHFEQVTGIMNRRGIAYLKIDASRYAAGLHQLVRKQEPGKLVDMLIVGAIIEARSCERFAALAPLLDEELRAFYLSLLKSEARHFQDYLKLAEQLAQEDIQPRIAIFLGQEKLLIESPDEQFRFHSGVPVRT
jgi:tRNA-(ms[2]io[6]A)-hydroxylase